MYEKITLIINYYSQIVFLAINLHIKTVTSLNLYGKFIKISYQPYYENDESKVLNI